jgi:Icc-related predicted phosphoesterase
MKKQLRGAWLFGSLLVLAACASAPPPPPPPPAPKPVVVEAEPEEELPETPRTWNEIKEIYGDDCPTPLFTLDEPHTIEAQGQRFIVEGSVARREGPAWKGPLRIGVIGAPKDQEPLTRENLRRAVKQFKKAKVHYVLVNGDVAEADAGKQGLLQLGEELPFVTFFHSGNIEWTNALSDAYFEMHSTHPHLINMNFIRHVDLGGVHLMSIPGWDKKRFVKPGACFSRKEDVDVLAPLIDAANDKGEPVILTAHGPPIGKGKLALDFAFDAGNVGNEDMQTLITEHDVRFGIFSHILEAGGRAATSTRTYERVKMPLRKPQERLYVNVGSASSYGWRMHDKKTSRGMAAIYVVDKGKATVRFLKLRP